ncbi:hypothetical protein I4U23_007904 [Adineta vaga]|nr:hypothetical protein I4U23_007904 [Adineta vaga]
MYRLTLLLLFLCVLFIQFHPEQAASVYLPSADDTDDQPVALPSSSLLKSWYNKRFSDLEDNDQNEYMEHLWKRYSPELGSLRQRRRFGNTRYGRSLSEE